MFVSIFHMQILLKHTYMHSIAPKEHFVSRLAFAIEWRNHSTVRDVCTRYIICMEENAFVSIGISMPQRITMINNIQSWTEINMPWKKIITKRPWYWIQLQYTRTKPYMPAFNTKSICLVYLFSVLLCWWPAPHRSYYYCVVIRAWQ